MLLKFIKRDLQEICWMSTSLLAIQYVCVRQVVVHQEPPMQNPEEAAVVLGMVADLMKVPFGIPSICSILCRPFGGV